MLALDLLREAALAVAQAVGDLVQRAPTLGRVRLELAGRGLDGLLDLPLDLGAQARDVRALLVGCRTTSRSVSRGEARLRVGDQLPLALLEAGELGGEPLAQALEVLRPGVSLPSNSFWAPISRRRELGQDALLGAGDLVAALLGQLAVLLGELRRRLRALDRERALQLGLAALGLGFDQRLQALLRLRRRAAPRVRASSAPPSS